MSTSPVSYVGAIYTTPSRYNCDNEIRSRTAYRTSIDELFLESSDDFAKIIEKESINPNTLHEGKSLLEMSLSKGRLAYFEILLDKGADPFKENEKSGLRPYDLFVNLKIEKELDELYSELIQECRNTAKIGVYIDDIKKAFEILGKMIDSNPTVEHKYPSKELPYLSVAAHRSLEKASLKDPTLNTLKPLRKERAATPPILEALSFKA